MEDNEKKAIGDLSEDKEIPTGTVKDATLDSPSESSSVPTKESPSASSSKPKANSDRAFLIAVVIVVVGFAAFFYLPKLFFVPDPSLPKLFELNEQGRLSSDKGITYNGFSFVHYDDLWYTQVNTELRQYNIPFHYNPSQVEDIVPQGFLNTSNLDVYDNFYMTFDPLDEGLDYVAVSIGESNQIFIQAFGKGVIPACTNNESYACENRPIIECNSTAAPVFYYAHENTTNLLYLNNCAIISGQNEELLRATDRMLFNLLGIMR